MAPKRKRLKHLVVHEVSPVPKPANPRARILFHKSDRGSDMKTKPDTVDALFTAIGAAIQKAAEAVEIDEPTARKAAIEAAIAGLSEAKKTLAPTAKGTAEEDEDEGAADGIGKALTDLTEKMVTLSKSATDSEARVSKAETAAAAAVAEVTKLRAERREEEVTKEAMELTSNLGGEVAPVVKVLLALDGNKESRDAYVATLKAANASVGSSLTTELGRRSQAQVGVEAQVKTLAKALQTQNPKLSDVDAEVLVYEQNPDLYAKSLTPGSGSGAPVTAN